MKKPNEKVYFYVIATKEKVKTIDEIKNGKVSSFCTPKKHLKDYKLIGAIFQDTFIRLRDGICPEVEEEMKKEFLDKPNED